MTERKLVKKCICPLGFIDASCPLHRHEYDREQFERDMRLARIPRRYWPVIMEEENK